MLRKIINIGAGVGGLTTAALLAKAGYDVTVLEAQTYPGGCASSFTHKGFLFDSGATVIGGFQPGGPHQIVSEQLGLSFSIQRHEPAWITHLPDRSIALTAEFDDVANKLPGSDAFWKQQRRIGDLAWKLSADGLPWFPADLNELVQVTKTVVKNLPQTLGAAPFTFITVYDWMKRLNLHTDPALIRFLDSQLLISAQTTTKHVNAMYGATALHLVRQGVYHIEGGVGSIALKLAEKLESLGGKLLYRHRATHIKVREGRAVGVYARHGRHTKHEAFFPADFVIANVTPWNLSNLLADSSPPSLQREIQRRKLGWGAFVLHLGVKADAIPRDFADHHQIIADYDSPLGEANSIFLSLSPHWDSSRAPAGQRAVTISTHTRVQQWWDLHRQDSDAYATQKEKYTRRMIQLAQDRLLPGLSGALTLVLPGTPLTYAFYTERHLGMLGGFPQTSLLQTRGPHTGIQNLRLVGDSIFPGQSTAAVTLGAMRVASDIQRNFPAQSPVRAGKTQTRKPKSRAGMRI